MNDDAPAPAAPKSYRVRKESLSKLDALLVDLRKKAAKLGCEAPGYAVVGEETERRAIREDGDGAYRLLAANESARGTERVVLVPFVLVVPVGEAPRINGWRLAARIEHAGEAGNIVNHNPLVPEELPLKFRTCPADCEHCNLKRNRADTFALISDDGAFKQVGSDCLKDFLGHASPDALIQAADWIRELHEALDEAEAWGGGSGGKSYEDLDRVLAVTCAVIRIDGWVSRARAEASFNAVQATSGVVGAVLWPPRWETEDRRAWRMERAPNEGDNAKAKAVIEWAKALPADGNEYESNLRVLAHMGAVERLGLACSMAAAYDRHLGQLNEAARLASKRGSVHVGVVGERKVFKLECERVSPIQSEQWGMSYLCLFRDADGNVLKWFASSGAFHEAGIESGKHYRGKGTVKKHSDYQGIKETLLSRCKLSECAADALAEEPKPAKRKGKKGESVDAV